MYCIGRLLRWLRHQLVERGWPFSTGTIFISATVDYGRPATATCSSNQTWWECKTMVDIYLAALAGQQLQSPKRDTQRRAPLAFRLLGWLIKNIARAGLALRRL